MLPAAELAARSLRGQFQDGDWSRPAASGSNGSLIRILLRGVRSWLGIGELDRLGMCRSFLPHHPSSPFISFLHYYVPCVFAASSTRSLHHARHARLSSPFPVTFRAYLIISPSLIRSIHDLASSAHLFTTPTHFSPPTRDTTETATQPNSGTHNEGICRGCSGFGCFGERCGNASKDRG